MSTPQLVVHRDKELMAQAAAARLITRIVDAQASRGTASVVLTGGRNGNGLLAALAAAPARDAIDWGRLDLWWGDERFLPEGDPERNVTQAREALLDSVPLDPKRVHATPASDGPRRPQDRRERQQGGGDQRGSSTSPAKPRTLLECMRSMPPAGTS